MLFKLCIDEVHLSHVVGFVELPIIVRTTFNCNKVGINYIVVQYRYTSIFIKMSNKETALF